MKKRYIGIFGVLAALALLVSFLPQSTPVVKAGDQAWSSITLPEVINAGAIRAIAVVDANTGFAATSNAVRAAGTADSYLVRTTDGGVTWRPVGNFDHLNPSAPPELYGAETAAPQLNLATTEIYLSVSANYPTDKTLFVAINDPVTTVFQQVYRSKDGGDTFKIVGGENFCGTSERIRSLSVAPNYTENTDNSVVVGTINPGDDARGALYFYQTGFGGGWSARTGDADYYALKFTGGTSMVGVASRDVASVTTTPTLAPSSLTVNLAFTVSKSFSATPTAVGTYSGTATVLAANTTGIATWTWPAAAGASASEAFTWTLPTGTSLPTTQTLTVSFTVAAVASPPVAQTVTASGSLGYIGAFTTSTVVLADATSVTVPASAWPAAALVTTALAASWTPAVPTQTLTVGFTTTSIGSQSVTLIPSNVVDGGEGIYEFRATVVSGTVSLPLLPPSRVQVSTLVQSATETDQRLDVVFPSNWSAGTSTDTNLISYSTGGSAPLGRVYRRYVTTTTLGYTTTATSDTYGFATLAMTGNASTGTVFAGTEVGAGALVVTVYSIDGGQTWNSITAGDRYGIDGYGARVQVAIGGANAVYVGTGGTRGGVFKSPNLGATWMDCALYSDNINVYVDWSIVDENIIFIIWRTATESQTHMFRTADGGTSWRRVSRTSYQRRPRPSPKFSTDNIVWMTRSVEITSQVWRSLDGGFTWAATPADPSDTLAVTNSSADSDVRLWAIMNNGQIAQTQDGGNTWTLSTTSPSTYIVSLVKSTNFAVDNTLAGMLDSTARNVWISRDAGNSWTQYGATPAGNNRGNTLFSPDYKTDKRIYASTRGSDGGIFRLDDDGTVTTTSSWTQLATTADMKASVWTQGTGASTGVMVGTPTFVGKTFFVPVGNRIASCFDLKATVLEWRTMPVGDTTGAPDYSSTLLSRQTGKTVAGKVTLWTNGPTVTGASTFITLTDSAIAPKLLSPADKAGDVARFAGMSWGSVSGTTLYEAQLGLVATLEGATKKEIADTGIETGQWYGGDGMTPGGAYYWRVRAKAPMTGPWSAIQSFTVLGGPTVVPPTPTSVPVVTNKLVLASGWNLVSIPKALADSSVAKVFKDVTTIEKVYGRSDETWLMATFAGGVWGGTLTSLAPGAGYWVKTSAATTVTLTFKPADPLESPPAYDLAAGWSLIGYSTLSLTPTQPVGVYLTSLAGKWTSLYSYDATTGYNLAKPGYGFANVELFRGYWIYLNAAGALVP